MTTPGAVGAAALREVDGGIEADLGGPRLRIEPARESVLRIRFTAQGSWRPRRPWAVTADPADRALPQVRATVDAQAASMDTGALTADVDARARLVVRRADGSTLLEDAGERGLDWTRDGPRAWWRHVMPPGRRYLGFGERTGLLDKRGRRMTCWTTDAWQEHGPRTDSLYLAIPFQLAIDADGRAFGVFLDSTFRSAFDLRDLGGGTASMEVEDGELDWYLLDGPTPAEVVERFTALVGRPPLPPRWSLGYHQGRWSYGSDAEVRAVARSLREHRLPADAINIDIGHLDGHRVFTWDRERFPDPAGLIADLRADGFRATVIVDAAVKQDPGHRVYDEGRRRGAFVRRSRDPSAPEVAGELWAGRCVLPDFARADVRAWWAGLHREYLGQGVAGFVNDMNEPALHDLPMDDPETRNIEPPPDTPFGDEPEPATHAEVRNVYGSLMTRATVEAMAAARRGQRPFVASRAGFAGIQRDAMVWTGDNASAWEHLAMSLPQLLNLGLSGVAFAGADVGGFYADCPDELLVRWMQLGAAYPFFRNNAAEGTARQEPWARGEPTLSRCREALELRYRLLPYLYGVARSRASPATRWSGPWPSTIPGIHAWWTWRTRRSSARTCWSRRCCGRARPPGR